MLLQIANHPPAEVKFILWSAPADGGGGGVDEVGEEEEQVVPGSLQEILDGLEIERVKAVDEALNPPHELVNGIRSMSGEEGMRRIKEASAPYKEKMEEARQRFVTEGKMTAEEAKSVVGYDDEAKKARRKAKKHLQKAVNKVEIVKRKAMDLVDIDGTRGMTLEEARGRLKEAIRDNKGDLFVKDCYKHLLKAFAKGRPSVAEASKVFEEKMNDARDWCGSLTAEERKAVVPDVEGEVDTNSKGSKKDEEKDNGAEEELPSRVVTDKGFPITKAGFEKYVEITKEVLKRDQDAQGVYIYNDFSGYGATEVLENTVCRYLVYKKSLSNSRD